MAFAAHDRPAQTVTTRNRPAVPAGRLGLGQGTALFVGALLGPGVLALPHLAFAAAGPAAIVAWVLLLGLSVPVALTFAALGARFPDAGGVAAFTGRAFGFRVSSLVGWWFYSVIPIGGFAAALIGGDYVAAALGLGRPATITIAAALLVAAFITNHAGLRTSGRAQLCLSLLLAILLVAAILAGVRHVQVGNFTPFAPHGLSGIGRAASVLFFAFAGWEAGVSLSAEFADPRRLVHRVTVLTLVIVAVLHLGLAVTVTGVLGQRAASSAVPLSLLMEQGIGPGARYVTAIAAAVMSFGVINTYLAGTARLGAALAQGGALPEAIGRGVGPGRTPHRSLALLAVLTAVVAAVALPAGLGLDTLMRATAACLAAVTVVAVAAAARILSGRHRALAWTATVFTVAVLVLCGRYLLMPATIAVACLLYLRSIGRPSPSPRRSSQ